MLIDIAKISLDVKNFRHGDLASEREALQIMISDEKSHKVSELADDIVRMGRLDPSSALIVTEDAAHPGQYIALEGNRRMTALKAMINPDLAAGFSTHPTFRKLNPRFMALGLTQVECVVLDRAEASDWIKRKHYNAMGGRGVIEWNAVATARSDASDGPPAILCQAGDLPYMECDLEDCEPVAGRGS
ncbi:hypothetical protein [Shinella sp. M27]|uniref:hypothetical protein n=1 Tax=Shinella sp. M27 TaxID=3368614 RepID=UPI003BA3D9B2